MKAFTNSQSFRYFCAMFGRVSIGHLVMIFLCWLAMACNNPETTEKKANTPPKTTSPTKQKTAPKVQSSGRLIPKGGAPQFLKKYAAEHPQNIILIQTRLGDMKIRLFEETPMHRANFIFLAKNGFLDHTLFYRIEKGFMIQGGGTDDESVVMKRNKLGKYKVPAEIVPKYFHKRGALAMARSYTDNPQKESSEFNFYIVQGKTYSQGQLKALELEHDIVVPDARRKTYETVGGAPHIDGEHTVFGEVIEGLEVIDKIANVEVDKGGWPFEDISLTVKVIE